MKHIISLGAGVQSSTMALMAACGEITPMPDAAIFADTQDEPKEVYTHLEWLLTVLPFPVHIVTAGKLSQRHLEGFNGARTPFFIKAGGMAKRQCTREFKIRPLRRKVRELLGYDPRGRIPAGAVSQWIGISTDEADRQKPSGVTFAINRWPLLEDATRMSRSDCKRWLWERYRRAAPKSACKQCPYGGEERLLHLKETDPEGFTELCEYDAALRTPEHVARWRGELYVHPSCVPLVQIDLDGLGKTKRAQGNLFTNECEGMCGV
jgi:hypothetical protein